MDNEFLPLLEEVILGYLRDKDKGLPPGYFKQFYLGDPLYVPLTLLPCVIVEAQRSHIEAGPTGMDKIDTTIIIKLVYNKREDVGTTTNEILGYKKIRLYAEGRDPVTKEYASTSVMGILRKYFTLANPDNSYNVLDQVSDPQYFIVPRGKGILTAEANITTKFHQILTVTGRQ